ncbi:UNVERIFIED_CONTAM: DExH-box ATP-dependent RNA helicase DExH3 [Sesamum latifolium]|uniref:RNA helicase n=1 Tax=Sesamum latifolium TaxID=2727402 RepID=A0AAW2VET1_9LAMI
MVETSITINGVAFVVDCGKAKETSFDLLNNTPCLLPSWITKALARQLVKSAKAQFSDRDFSDHLAVRAFDGWNDIEREHSGYEYCWRNFLSIQNSNSNWSPAKAVPLSAQRCWLS